MLAFWSMPLEVDLPASMLLLLDVLMLRQRI
jgi:hypothetical protein